MRKLQDEGAFLTRLEIFEEKGWKGLCLFFHRQFFRPRPQHTKKGNCTKYDESDSYPFIGYQLSLSYIKMDNTRFKLVPLEPAHYSQVIQLLRGKMSAC
jgi:hypothetical protein